MLYRTICNIDLFALSGIKHYFCPVFFMVLDY